jgi:hypothetical protein
VCDRVAAIEGTPASCARTLGVSWSTVWAAVVEYGTPQVDAAGRVGVTAMVGFDETVMQPAHRRRRRRFVTAVVDVATGQMIDVFEGRDADDLRLWLAGMPPEWRAAVQAVSVDPHEGYRSAITDTAAGEGVDGRGPVPHRAARQPGAHEVPPTRAASDARPSLLEGRPRRLSAGLLGRQGEGPRHLPH